MPCSCPCCCGCCCDGETGTKTKPSACTGTHQGVGTECDVCCVDGEIDASYTQEDCPGTWVVNGRCAGCAECCGYFPDGCTLTATVVWPSPIGTVVYTYDPVLGQFTDPDDNGYTPPFAGSAWQPLNCQSEDGDRADPKWATCCVLFGFADTPNLEDCLDYSVYSYARLLCNTCCQIEGVDSGVGCTLTDQFTEAYVVGSNCNEPLSITLALSCGTGTCDSEGLRVKSVTSGGPGTELKKLLAGFPLYIKTTPSCPCNKRATLMDINERKEPGWCEKNIDTIVGWLKEEHARRKILMPFSEIAVKQLVRLAIRRAKRANSQ